MLKKDLFLEEKNNISFLKFTCIFLFYKLYLQMRGGLIMNKVFSRENGFTRIMVILLIIMSFSLGITLASLRDSQEKSACRIWAEEEIHKAEEISMLF